MILLVDRNAVDRAIFLTARDEGDWRRYYDLHGALIVVRDNMVLEQLVGRKVDAQAGWDTAMPGFVLDESRIGKQRTKITIYRIVTYPFRATRLIDQIKKGVL